MYISDSGEPTTLFKNSNHIGETPKTLNLNSGVYYVGFLLDSLPVSCSLSIYYPPVRNVATVEKGSAWTSFGGGFDSTPDLVCLFARPERHKVSSNEREPYLRDVLIGPTADLTNAMQNFSKTYYVFEESKIIQVGQIYQLIIKEKISTSHVSVFLPASYMPIRDHIVEICSLYPKEKLWPLQQKPDEVEKILNDAAIPKKNHPIVIELLEKGGKVIYGGPFISSKSITFEKGMLFFVRNLENDCTRCVLAVTMEGQIEVKFYGMASIK